MTTLPYINDNKVEHYCSWNLATRKIIVETGAEYLSLTRGFKPTVRTGVLNWIVRPAEAKVVLDFFEADNFNGVYDYVCDVYGAIRIRPTGDASFTESDSDDAQILSVGFRRV